MACDPLKGAAATKKKEHAQKTRGGGALPRAKSTAKSEAKIRASRRTRPSVRCVSVAKASRRAAAVRQQPKKAPEKLLAPDSPTRRRDEPNASSKTMDSPYAYAAPVQASLGAPLLAPPPRAAAVATMPAPQNSSKAGHGPEEAEETEDGLPLLLRCGAQGGFGCGSRQGQSRQQHVEQAVRHDLGVPRCCGAFTPSTRLVSRRGGRGWSLFSMLSRFGPRRDRDSRRPALEGHGRQRTAPVGRARQGREGRL